MVEPARQYAVGFRARCYLFAFLFATWLVLTSNLQWQELLTGALVSVMLTASLAWTYARLGLPPLTPRRLWYFCVYLVVLLREIVRANLDVAYRVIHPKLPIKPGIVAIRTELKQDIAKMLLANSITLTPGTFTLDILGDTMLIHWIDVRSEDMEEAARLISGRFEKYLREIFA